LRAERDRRRGHHLLAHLRNEAYREYRRRIYPGSVAEGGKALSVEGNDRAIAEGKRRLGQGG
jgi:hypothetical protein